MKAISRLRFGKQTIWHDPTVLAEVDPHLFDPGWLQANGYIQGSSAGRSQAYFLHHSGHDLVLRPFRRGGLIGRFNRDRYLRLGAGRSRAMREFVLLDWMLGQGLPVPQPVAANYRPSGLGYGADLITVRIPDARPLAELLRHDALAPSQWARIGAMIGQMHKLGVDHTDLNCRNILLDGAGQGWLIDFDKCSRRAPGGWIEGNLARLRRSLEKERRAFPALAWSDEDWNALVAGHSDRA